MSSRPQKRTLAALAVATTGLALLVSAAWVPAQAAPASGGSAATASAESRGVPDDSWMVDPRTPAERRAEIAVPERPKLYDGRLRETRAVYRTKAGALAVPMRQAFGHQVKPGQAVTLDGTGLFEVNSVRLTEAARVQVVRLAAALDDAVGVRCEGYADYAGAAARNWTLAKGRADAVCDLLASTHDGLRTRIRSYGPSWPAAVGGTSDARRLNRRVVVEMIAGVPPAPVGDAPGAPELIGAQGGDSVTYFGFIPPVDVGSSPITGYEVSTGGAWGPVVLAVGRTAGMGCRVARIPCGVLYGQLTGLTPETTLDLQVRAVNDVGAGPASNTVSVSVYGKPSAPTALVVVGSAGSLSFTFGAPVTTGGVALTAYEYSTDLGLTWLPYEGTVAGSTVTVTGLRNGTTYDVWVRAVNEFGAGPAATGSALVSCRGPVRSGSAQRC